MGKRPKDAKIWNEDLMRALNCRAWHARQEQKQVPALRFEAQLIV